jgi:hypothetical protein
MNVRVELNIFRKKSPAKHGIVRYSTSLKPLKAPQKLLRLPTSSAFVARFS